ncbi:MAG: hypothetical protein COW79_02785, partial [Bdellovibrionales bacterium CG22_combo_CG10-13_8_21_14_all_38_13]
MALNQYTIAVSAKSGVRHVIRRGGTPPEVWLAPNLYPLVEAPEQIKEYRWVFGDGSSLVMPFAESPDGFVKKFQHTWPGDVRCLKVK